MAEQENYEGRSNGLSQAAKGMGISDRFRLFPLVGRGVGLDSEPPTFGYKESPQTSRLRGFSGASDVTRTRDLLITNQLHYRLCYTSIKYCYFFYLACLSLFAA